MDNYEIELKKFIRNCEERIDWYKNEIEYLYKSKNNDREWILTLKELKRNDESYLKRHIKELVYYRQGLNPPYLYGE